MSTPLPTGPVPASRPTTLVITLIAIVAVLLLVVVGLTFFVIGRNSGGEPAAVAPPPTSQPVTSLPSETALPSAPSEQPTATTQPAPQPVDTKPHFTSFTGALNVACDPTGQQDRPEIHVKWASVNAVEAWYSANDNPVPDAAAQAYMKVPTTGDQNDLTDEHLFPCNHRQYLYVTITLVGSHHEHVSKTLTYTDTNWNSGGDDEDD